MFFPKKTWIICQSSHAPQWNRTFQEPRQWSFQVQGGRLFGGVPREAIPSACQTLESPEKNTVTWWMWLLGLRTPNFKKKSNHAKHTFNDSPVLNQKKTPLIYVCCVKSSSSGTFVLKLPGFLVREFWKDPYISQNIPSPKPTVRKEAQTQKETHLPSFDFSGYVSFREYIPPRILKHPIKAPQNPAFWAIVLIPNSVRPTYLLDVIKSQNIPFPSAWADEHSMYSQLLLKLPESVLRPFV